MMTQEQAEEAGRGLAKYLGSMTGGPWRGDAWENVGWHHRAVSHCGRLKVHPCTGGDFYALLGEAGKSSGRWVAYAVTPRMAVERVIAKARSERDEINKLLEGLI